MTDQAYNRATSAKILIVDDTDTKRYFVSRVLQNAGFDIFEASTGERCLTLAKQEHPDLIVLDIRLPDISGYEVCRRLRSDPETSDIAIMHLSASLTETDDEVHGLDEGADGYLTQPVEATVLIAHINALLRMRRAEGEAQEKALQWQRTFDAIADGIILVDKTGMVARCNKAVAQLLQKSQTDITESSFKTILEDIFGEEQAAKLIEDSYQLPRTTIEATLYGRDISISVDPITDTHDAPNGLVCIVTDATQRKLAEAKLRESDERFHILTENVRDYAIFLTDPLGTIMTWNAGVFRILGYEEDELVGKPFTIIFNTEDQRIGAPAQELESARRTGRSEDKRWHVRKDGSLFWADGVLTSFLDDNGKIGGFIKIMRDRTQQKITEDKLAELYHKQTRIAETLQRSMLFEPPKDIFPGVEVFTHYDAAFDEAQIGGDFYDAFRINSDKIAFVVGDVSGKGLAAASRTAEVKYAFRALIHESGSPSQALTRLNNFLYEMHQHDSYDMSAFVVISAIILDIGQRKATCASAGAEPVIIIRADSQTEPVFTQSLLLGVKPDAEYVEAVVELNPGDTLLMVTDGITEARRGSEMLAWEGVADLAVKAGSNSSLHKIAGAVLTGAKAFGGGPLRDDACLLLARLKPSNFG